MTANPNIAILAAERGSSLKTMFGHYAMNDLPALSDPGDTAMLIPYLGSPSPQALEIPVGSGGFAGLKALLGEVSPLYFPTPAPKQEWENAFVEQRRVPWPTYLLAGPYRMDALEL